MRKAILQKNYNLSTMKAVQIGMALAVLGVVGFARPLAAQTLGEGIAQMEKENYSAARQIFRKLIQTNPTDADAHYYLGESFYENDNLDSARYFYNKGIEVNSRGPLNYAGLGKLALDAKNTKDANKNLDRALSLGKKSGRAFLEVGRAYLLSDNKDVDKAIETLTLGTGVEPKNADLFSALGDAYREKGDAGKAVTNYDFATDKDKKNPKNFTKKAKIWSRAKVYDQAVLSLEECIKIDPTFAPAYKDMIEVYVAQNQYTKALPYLKKYTELSGKDIEARERLVKVLCYYAKDYDAAIAEAQNVLSQDTGRYTMHRWLGMSQTEKGDYPKGYDAWIKFFQVVGDRKVYSSDYEYFAKSAAKNNQRDVAINSYKKLLEMDSTRTDVYDFVATSYRDAKDYPKVIEAYNTKLSKVKANANDYYYLGQAHYTLKNYPAADSAFTKYVELYPNVVGYVYKVRIANVLDPEATANLAKPFQEKVIEYGEKDKDKNKKYLSDAYNYLGYYYLRSTDPVKARDYFQKTLAIDAANANATEGLNSIK